MYVQEGQDMKQRQNFLKIPVNRILALILLDVMSVLIASFMALNV